MIRWLSAFIDMPAESFERGVGFWKTVSGSTLSSARGDTGEFATLLPTDGDAYLRVQRLADGDARIHLDLHVPDWSAAAARAVGLGATITSTDDPDHTIMASPGGFVFCFVSDEGEAIRPSPFDLGGSGPALIDQIAIDVPSSMFDVEAAFWSALTGWPWRPNGDPEFEILDRPDGIPLRLLLQRLGNDDDRTTVTAHLDIASGDHREAVAIRHCELGAEVTYIGQQWTRLRDPAGMHYCLTHRDPVF